MNRLDILSLMRGEGERTFFIDAPSDRAFTYASFLDRALCMAARFKEAGVQNQDRVVLFLPNAPEFACAYLACLLLGAVAVPVNPALPSRDLDYIFAHARATLLVYAAKTASAIPVAAVSGVKRLRIVLHKDSECADNAPTWRMDDPGVGLATVAAPSAGDLFSITFTSGTTNRPKGVPHRVEGLLASALAFNKSLGFDDNTRMYHVMPMSYMAGFLNTILCPLVARGSIVSNGPFDARLGLDFWSAAARYEVDTLWVVPSMLTSLLKLDRGDRGQVFCRERVRAACIGTAPLPLALKIDFEKRYGVALHESYGLSETLFLASNSGAVPYKAGSVGKLLEGVELRLLGADGTDVAPTAEGEIHVKVPWMMAGYLDPETGLPDPSTSPAWFPSGDLGKIDGDGHLFITGRKKDLIIRGGANISPRAIEEWILGDRDVQQAAVVGVPHSFYGEDAVAFICIRQKEETAAIQQRLLSNAREQLGAAFSPSRVIVVDELPVNTTGKVLKNRLREMWQAGEFGQPT